MTDLTEVLASHRYDRILVRRSTPAAQVSVQLSHGCRVRTAPLQGPFTSRGSSFMAVINPSPTDEKSQNMRDKKPSVGLAKYSVSSADLSGDFYFSDYDPSLPPNRQLHTYLIPQPYTPE